MGFERTAFGRANDILTMAAKGIAEIITKPGHVNFDFADVKTVMLDSGAALMGVGYAEGEDRAVKAAKAALDCPLLNNNDIRGSKNMLVSITSSTEKMLTTEEMADINSYMQGQAGDGADLIWGNSYSDDLGDKVSVTVIATGFKAKEILDPYKEGCVLKRSTEKKGESGETIKPKENDPIIIVEPKDEFTQPKGEESKAEEIGHKAGDKIIFEPSPENDKIVVDEQSDNLKSKSENEPKNISEVATNDKISAVDYSTIVDREFQYIDEKPAYLRKNIQLLGTPKQGEKYEHLKLELPVEE